MYSDQELGILYPSDYYAYQDKFHISHWKELLKRLLGYSTGTKDPHFEAPGTVLDLGCGSGWFLQGMRARGWITYGVEISEAATTMAQRLKGLQIFCGTLQEAKFPAEFFDYVRSNHSFEHMSCPNNTLDEIQRILKPEGKLLVGVPNVDSLNARLFKRYWWYLGVPVHPFTYSVRTLSQILAKHNFTVDKIAYNSDYTGILGSLQIFRNRNNQKKSTEGHLINSLVLRLICHWLAKCMDLFRTGDAIEITARKAL
jgi:SAM-dependent methyltransferase